MSLRSIQHGISEAVSGKDCKLCKRYGVTCHDIGLFDSAPGHFGETVVYVNREAVMRTGEKIADCPAVLGNETQITVASKIKSNAKKLEGYHDISDLRTSNY